MTTPAPVEQTIRYATTVDALPDAWAFVMDHIDEVGPAPSIKISPLSRQVVGEDEWTNHFEVAVSGMRELTEGRGGGHDRSPAYGEPPRLTADAATWRAEDELRDKILAAEVTAAREQGQNEGVAEERARIVGLLGDETSKVIAYAPRRHVEAVRAALRDLIVGDSKGGERRG